MKMCGMYLHSQANGYFPVVYLHVNIHKGLSSGIIQLRLLPTSSTSIFSTPFSSTPFLSTPILSTHAFSINTSV